MSEGHEERINTITPLTVKQVLRASQMHSIAPIRLDGRELGYVKCIGNLLEIDKRDEDGFCLLRIEDGTRGRLTIFMYKENNELTWNMLTQSLKAKEIMLHRYACVVGKIGCSKSWPNKITAKIIVPIEDPHEIFFHFLECMFVFMKVEDEKSNTDEETMAISGEPPTTNGGDKQDVGDKYNGEENSRPQSPSPSDESSVVEYATENDELSSDSDEDVDRSVKGDSSASSSEREDEGESRHSPANLSNTEVQSSSTRLKKDASEGELQDVQASMKSLTVSLNNNGETEQAQAATSEVQPSSNMDPLSKLSNAQRALILHIHNKRDETWEDGETEWKGLHISEVVRILQRHDKNIDKFGIFNALEELMSEGLLTTMIDETHFDLAET